MGLLKATPEIAVIKGEANPGSVTRLECHMIHLLLTSLLGGVPIQMSAP